MNPTKSPNNSAPIDPSASGALLVQKEAGLSSFGVLEQLQRVYLEHYGVKRRDGLKLGHGGTLDPFATGLLIVLVGKAVKLSQYFLGSEKEYTGVIRFGQTTIPGDPTEAVSERSEVLPASFEEAQKVAQAWTLSPYDQIPPMHSAKKQDGQRLYELARKGKDVERDAKRCVISRFDLRDWNPPTVRFRVRCSSGTYIRTLAQDFGRKLGTVAMLDSLHRVGSGRFTEERSLTVGALMELVSGGQKWTESPAWVDFDELLRIPEALTITDEEARILETGLETRIPEVVARAPKTCLLPWLPMFCEGKLIGVLRREEDESWRLDRVFPRGVF